MSDCRDSGHCPASGVQHARRRYHSALDEHLDDAARRRRADYGMDRYLSAATLGRLTELLAAWGVPGRTGPDCGGAGSHGTARPGRLSRSSVPGPGLRPPPPG